jgi:hypothetical protein
VQASFHPGIGQALRLGGRSTFSSWGAYLGAFVAALVAALAVGASAGLFWLLPLGVDVHTLMLGGVALGLLWLTAQLLRALLLGAGLLQASARLRGVSPLPVGAAVGEAASRSWAWFLYGILLETLRAGWQLLALGLGGFAYVHSLITGAHGVLDAAGLAIAVTAAVALWIGFALWVDYAFARAIAGSPFAVALFDSVGILWRAPGRPLAILLLTGLIAGGLHLLVGVTPGELVGPGGVRPLWLWGALVGAAVAAFVDTGVTLLRLGAFAALEVGEPEPIVEATPILEATPVEPGPQLG